MTIQAQPVQRNQYGYWTHSEYPSWAEWTDEKVMHKWFSDRGLCFQVVYFESDVSEEKSERFFGKGDPDVTDWQPTKPHPDAFLLSIHDTENGPVAIWAVHGDQSTLPSA
ncbi:TPA: hypothetical protein ACMDT2_004178 [Vibrio parahaemolyticus]|nr:hypothetical protein [Vibrio parahaemolyticus]